MVLSQTEEIGFGPVRQKMDGTYNAAHPEFGSSSDSDETRIQNAIDAADSDATATKVFLPESMFGYDPSAVAFKGILMVREGQRTDRVDVIAYGAVGDGPGGTDDLTAVDTAASEADSLGYVAVWHPTNTYTVSGDPTFPGDTFPVGQGASYDGSSTTIPNLVDPAQFSGTGIEGDGSGNLRIASAAAGDGLKGGSGSALAVEPADIAGAGLEDDGSDNLRIASAAAGSGLTGGSGSALAIDFSSANDWTGDQTFSGKLLFDDTADAANSDQAARPVIHHGSGSASAVGIDGALHTEDV